MALNKPLKLKRETVQLARARAGVEPFVQVLVDHRILHLEQYFEYEVPEVLSTKAIPGALVEIEFGSSITLGVIVDRHEKALSGGPVKPINKVLSGDAYLLQDQLLNIQRAAKLYGTRPWDFIRTCVPPFSKMGEKASRTLPTQKELAVTTPKLPQVLLERLLSSEHLICAIEIPTSIKYWEVVAAVALARLNLGSVLLLVPNEREAMLLERTLRDLSHEPLLISSSQGKSERYRNYLLARSTTPVVIIGTRSAALFSLRSDATIICLDDVDESHYERQAPTWNTRELVGLREAEISTIYISNSLSLEIAQRILNSELPLFQFPQAEQIRVKSSSQENDHGYYELIREGLSKGSVLLSVGAVGYVTSFSCQKCRNIATCTCGGKLFFPSKGSSPRCSLCQSVYLEWICDWCQSSKPRMVASGVERRAEEFGRSFPNHQVLTSTAAKPIAVLPEGNNLVLSTPGVEPRGNYSAEIFLDIERRLMRTTLRAGEEIRLQVNRNLSMLVPGGSAYFSLQASDAFLQSIILRKSLVSAAREIEERDGVGLPPHYLTILISGENIDGIVAIFTESFGENSALNILGPFLRAGKKTVLLKAPKHLRGEITQLLQQINKVQSARKSTLLTYQIDPYSLN